MDITGRKSHTGGVPAELFPRAIDRLIVQELLPVFPAILLVGPRGSGKSTSMARLADTILDLSVPGTRLAASEDPDGVLTVSTGTVLIDEWQEVPEILGAVKRAVDRDRARTPGRFLITGSVRAAHQATTWPGTGRLIRVRMYGLTQAEIEGDGDYNPIDSLFSSSMPPYGTSPMTRADYLERVVAGRFPAVLGLEGRNRSRWFSAYVEQLVERDAGQLLARDPRPAHVRAALNSCAARTAQELNKSATAADGDMDYRTAERMLGLLEDLSIVVRVPAWHAKRLKRLTSTPKVHLTDTGMAAYMLKVGADQLGQSPALIGPLFESFVIGELTAHIEAVSEETDLFHLRDRDGREVDAVLERHGRVVCIEVKSSSRVDGADARGLIWMRERLGDQFHRGVVLYSGSLPFQLSEKVWALPLSSLWRAPVDTGN
jgi:predicted AAA+ superfamily ATPase